MYLLISFRTYAAYAPSSIEEIMFGSTLVLVVSSESSSSTINGSLDTFATEWDDEDDCECANKEGDADVDADEDEDDDEAEDEVAQTDEDDEELSNLLVLLVVVVADDAG